MPDIYIAHKKPPRPTQFIGHPVSSFFSFAQNPTNLGFENQEKGEQIELFLRRHPITNIPWIIAAVFMIFAPALLRFFPILGFLPENFQLVSVLIWYLLTTAFILESLLSWLFNVYIVTNERVIDIDFTNLIYKEVSDAELGKIQDVTYKMGGVVRTLFNYGDVEIQTAGTAPNFDFAAVPRPGEVAKILQDLREGKGHV